MTLRILINLTIGGMLSAAILGCDDRSLEIAREAAARQAQQNHEMARVTREAAAANRRLVEEQGDARRELHGERSTLNAGRDALEQERNAIASARRTESFLAAIIHGGGAAFAAILALGMAWLTLFGLSRKDDDDLATELLLLDVIAVQPQLMLPQGEQASLLSPLPSTCEPASDDPAN